MTEFSLLCMRKVRAYNTFFKINKIISDLLDLVREVNDSRPIPTKITTTKPG